MHRISVEYELDDVQFSRLKRLQAAMECSTPDEAFSLIMWLGTSYAINEKMGFFERTEPFKSRLQQL